MFVYVIKCSNGINRVRGGSYSTLILSKETIEHIKKDIFFFGRLF